MKKESKKENVETPFARFEFLTKNLMSVSNKEVREKMSEEKRKKKNKKRKVS
jgi:hypothetical protein